MKNCWDINISNESGICDTLYSINNSWHSVSESPWPFYIRLGTFSNFCSILIFFNEHEFTFLKYSLIINTLICFAWFRDVNRERNEGEQRYNVKDGLKVAIIFFILREVLFFTAWFWGFFHNSMSPINEVGNVWPPSGINSINPYSIPILNTFLLLRSGVSVTWAHNSFFNLKSIFFQIFTTIFLGILFTINQGVEYIESSFSISDRIYGRTFFVTTGFHGLHVIIGRIFLLIIILIINAKNSNPFTNYIAFEFSIWYWHFVDIVWLFLISFIYLWN